MGDDIVVLTESDLVPPSRSERVVRGDEDIAGYEPGGRTPFKHAGRLADAYAALKRHGEGE